MVFVSLPELEFLKAMCAELSPCSGSATTAEEATGCKCIPRGLRNLCIALITNAFLVLQRVSNKKGAELMMIVCLAEAQTSQKFFWKYFIDHIVECLYLIGVRTVNKLGC